MASTQQEPVRLWEWSVARDSQGGSVGVAKTRHGAMQALARALIQAGRPRDGHVMPVVLTEAPHEAPRYLRGTPERTAVYDGEVIRWH